MSGRSRGRVRVNGGLEWVKDMNVLIDDGNIRGYKVNIDIAFVLEDGS